MPRDPLMKSPVRLHLSLEKKTVDQLRKKARRESKTITQTLRELAESYAEGRLALKTPESLRHALQRIQALRQRSAGVSDRSESVIRAFRDARA